MEQGEYLYIVGLGSSEDWGAARGSFYYIEDKNGETVLPVFTAPEKAGAYVEGALNITTAHMEMLESIGVRQAPALTAGRFVIMPFAPADIAGVAANVGAGYLVRDPRPGPEQEILRFSE